MKTERHTAWMRDKKCTQNFDGKTTWKADLGLSIVKTNLLLSSTFGSLGKFYGTIKDIILT